MHRCAAGDGTLWPLCSVVRTARRRTNNADAVSRPFLRQEW
ncbi:hypothetical protein HMPREF9598_01327 [Cutibacterium acnes HL050PA1]|nr:hypothetical protein HMPREF9598_01327 [Cutibacterium acnes HL050PA1]EFT06822.1 hypothetical protein HMPREF9618_02047 [Cutibacterium acnes HL082PA1]EGF00608.1 hypothetical protein HMPREF9586_01917 [Cutibacterium acnes HL083PA2]